jgi:hypothetical protein
LRQAAIYGKCVVADYNAVHKDKCLTEFMKLKDCYLVSDFVLITKYSGPKKKPTAGRIKSIKMNIG